MHYQVKASGQAGRRAALFLVCLLFVFGIAINLVQQVAAERFNNRGLYVNSARASDTTYYIITFGYTTASSIGSVRMEFCTTAIPSLPCNAPPGFDASGATLTTQSGETGYSIVTQTSNLIVLGRSASMTNVGPSSYRFDGMVNPNGDTTQSPEPDGEKTNFYVRLTSHASSDGTGPFIDYGSVANTVTPEQGIYTQVPPILIFCVAGTINDTECNDTSVNYVDFGELDPTQTAFTSSQILARTNASGGYTIAVTGKTMTSGIKSIPALTAPTASFTGTGQFGLNLAVNTNPAVGAAPTGPGTNAVLNPIYDTPDQFLFNDGDILVTSSNVTDTRKFTASYIVNIPADQNPGVYSTTITYVCTGSF